ncbi:hypothetical protein [Nostoc sp. C117]|uniref:hypothetical protein n=1 Tax=Nostoc sp. C117 TaxID=3349875 RepID=UPI00370D20A3
MDNNKTIEAEKSCFKLEAISTVVYDAVANCEGETVALLALLRELERLHREIRDGIFQESLPVNRRQLYSLLKDIESEGGWPYIERMRLQALLTNLPPEPTPENSLEELESDRSFG